MTFLRKYIYWCINWDDNGLPFFLKFSNISRRKQLSGRYPSQIGHVKTKLLIA